MKPWFVVEYQESESRKYVNSLEELAALVGMTPASAKTYIYRRLGHSPRQLINPDTGRPELASFSLVPLDEPLPEELKDLITAVCV